MKDSFSNKGSITILAITLLPILIGVMVGIFYFLEVIHLKESLRHTCRTELIKIQNDLIKTNSQLIKLNPKAKLLHQKRMALEAAAVATLKLPPAHAVVRARLTMIKNQQRLLDLQQKSLLTHATLKTQSSLLKFYKKFQSKFQRLGNLQIVDLKIVTYPSFHKGSALRPKQNRIAPEYETPRNFEASQSLEQKWKYSISIKKPLSYFKSYHQEFSDQCTISQIEKKDLFQLKINKGKYF